MCGRKELLRAINMRIKSFIAWSFGMSPNDCQTCLKHQFTNYFDANQFRLTNWLVDWCLTQKGTLVLTEGGELAQAVKYGKRDTMHNTLRDVYVLQCTTVYSKTHGFDYFAYTIASAPSSTPSQIPHTPNFTWYSQWLTSTNILDILDNLVPTASYKTNFNLLFSMILLTSMLNFYNLLSQISHKVHHYKSCDR